MACDGYRSTRVEQDVVHRGFLRSGPVERAAYLAHDLIEEYAVRCDGLFDPVGHFGIGLDPFVDADQFVPNIDHLAAVYLEVKAADE